MDTGRFSEAVDDFTFVIRHEPQIAGYYDNRQNAYRRSGRLDDALKDANKAIQLAPTYSFVFRGRGNVYNDMGKYDLAVLDYDQAIRLILRGAIAERGLSDPALTTLTPATLRPAEPSETKLGRSELSAPTQTSSGRLPPEGFWPWPALIFPASSMAARAY